MKIRDIDSIKIEYKYKRSESEECIGTAIFNEKIELIVDRVDNEVYVQVDFDGMFADCILLNIRNYDIIHIPISDMDKEFYLDVSIKEFKEIVKYVTENGVENIIEFITK